MNEYEWNAKDYQKHSKAQQEWAKELITKLRLKGTEAILDLGCGDGKVTAEIASIVPEGSVLGVDSSSDMIDLATEKFSNSDHPNLSFSLMDARELSFENQFDLIFSNAALHWIQDHQPAICGMYKSLCPGGRILLQMGGKGNAADIFATVQNFIKQPEWQPYFHDFPFPYGFYGPQEYRQWLEEAGFRVDRVELVPKDMMQAGRTGLAGWIRTTWLPYTDRVPEEKKEKLITGFIENYIHSFPPDDAGMIHIKMVRLEVEATKV